MHQGRVQNRLLTRLYPSIKDAPAIAPYACSLFPPAFVVRLRPTPCPDFVSKLAAIGDVARLGQNLGHSSADPRGWSRPRLSARGRAARRTTMPESLAR